MNSHGSIIDRIHVAMLNVGIVCSVLFAFDGIIHRFFVEGDKPNSQNGWYIGFDGDITTVVFGTWKDPGHSHTFCSKSKSSLTVGERTTHLKQLQRARKKRAEETARRQAKCRKNAEYIWEKATTKDIELNEYGIRKKIIPLSVKTSDRGNLIVPMYDINGELQSLQFIQADGTKRFMQGTFKKGHFSLIGEDGKTLQEATGIIICEGFATACSIHQATGYLVIVAFDCGNLKSVAEAIRNKYPSLQIIVAADDDIGTVGNPGLSMATEAARSVEGLLAFPVFKDHSEKSDFNDMLVEQGSEAVLNQIESAEPIANASTVIETIAGAETNSQSNSENADMLRDSYATSHFPLIAFPIAVLPEYMKLLVDRYSKALQCPAAFMAMNFLTVISGAVGNSITLAIKRSWKTAPFLWFGVIDISGAGKTHPQEAAMSPLRILQSIEEVRYDKDQEEYKVEKAMYERYKAEREPPPEPPYLRHYYTQSFTIESLVPMYKRSTRGIVIYVDELAGLLKSMGQYKSGKNSDDEQLLSLYGCKSLKADRATKNGFCRESGAAVMGGIQPGIFASVFGDKEQENGMLFRFLPMVMNSRPPMFSDDDISQDDEDEWSAIIDWMYEIPAEIDANTGCIVRNLLTLNAEGKAVFTQFHNELSVIQPFMPKRFSGYMAKLKDYCLKFICLLHVLECYEHKGLSLTVNKATVEGAVLLTRFFAGQALQLINGAAGHSNPYHDIVHKAIESLKSEVVDGKLLLTLIRLRMNETLPAAMQIDSTQHKRLGTWLKEIGLTVTTRADNKSVVLIV